MYLAYHVSGCTPRPASPVTALSEDQRRRLAAARETSGVCWTRDLTSEARSWSDFRLRGRGWGCVSVTGDVDQFQVGLRVRGGISDGGWMSVVRDVRLARRQHPLRARVLSRGCCNK